MWFDYQFEIIKQAMTTHRKKLERRTFLQDRFEILIKRQKKGVATFNELTELDDIVNRDPEIREKVIRESLLMEGADEFNDPNDNTTLENTPPLKTQQHRSLLEWIKSMFIKMFTAQILAIHQQKSLNMVV